MTGQPLLLRHLRRLASQRSNTHYWHDLALFTLRYPPWRLRTRIAGSAAVHAGPRAVVILVTYHRQYNVEPVVQALLKSGVVELILVANTNPRLRLRDFVQIRSPRLELIDEVSEAHSGYRYLLARDQAGRYFISLDDDIFPYPQQIEQLFSELVADPSRPHGLQGGVFSGPEQTYQMVRSRDANVDVLHRMYAFTREHADEYVRLCAWLGISDLRGFGNADDLVLSFSGSTWPRCHSVGAWPDCPTSAVRGIAIWRTTEHFCSSRRAIFEQLSRLRTPVWLARAPDLAVGG